MTGPTIKIVLVDPIGWDYTPETPRVQPLGGSQSALCYLAEALAAAGQHVSMVTATRTPGVIRGVHCITGADAPWLHVGEADVVIVLNTCPTPMLVALRGAVTAGCKLILWAHHAADEPAVAALDDPSVRESWDGFAFVSEWQRDSYQRRFGIAGRRCRILRNAIAPLFMGMFPQGMDIAAAKPWPPVLAYASAPYRGLDVLLESLPAIRAALPGMRLKVFSSLATYRISGAADPYADLYRRCAETEGVNYVGAVSQTELAGHLRDATMLAYLNRFAETSCITVMEALAAGCLVVTSRLGALPETGAGHCHLTDVPESRAEHAACFAGRVTEVVARHQDRAFSSRWLREQVDHVNAAATWPVRALAWLAWLEALRFGEPPPSVNAVGRALARGEPDQAERLCRAWLIGDPAAADGWARMADAHLARARWPAAARCLSREARLGGRRRPPHALLDGLDLNIAGDPIGELIGAAAALAAFAPDEAADLVQKLAGRASAIGDFAVSGWAYRLAMRLRPADIEVRIGLAWAESRCGRHLPALVTLRDSITTFGPKLLVHDQIRAIVRKVIEAAEQALLGGDARRDAAMLCRLIAELADMLGENAAGLMRAATLLDDLGPEEADVATVLVATALGQRRLQQGRPADALPLLRLVRQAGGGAAIAAQMVEAGLALAQADMLDALFALLEAGQQGKGPPGWRRSAGAMIEQIDRTLLLDHNGEENRSQVWARLRGYEAWLRYTAEPVTALPASPARRIYDCFQFYNELDLLAVRLAELSPVVDRFVLVEAAFTHAGDPKPLFFHENRERFAPFLDRIEHVVVSDDPGGFAWRREGHQREAIMRGLARADADDIILISDVDEIPRPETVEALRGLPAELASLHLAIHLYFLDLKSPETWISAAAAPAGLVRRVGANAIRYLVKQGLGRAMADAGWHFTWMGGLEGFRAKMAAYAHREHSGSFADSGSSVEARLQRFYATGEFDAGLIPGMWTDVMRVPIDQTFPASVRARIDDFRARGWLCPEGSRR